MNYLSNLFRGKKKTNRDAIIIANEFLYGKEQLALTDDNIAKIIKQNRIPVKMDNSLIKDIEDEYYRVKDNDTRMYEEERAYTKQERDLDAIRNKYRSPKPASIPKQDSDEDEWVDTSSSIEGGMKKRRKTKGKKTKRRKTRRNKRY